MKLGNQNSTVEAQDTVADGSPLQVLGQFEATARLDDEAEAVT